MRSLWCTLVAICLVAGGMRVSDAHRTRPGTSELHAAKAPVVAHAVRRAPGAQRRIGPFVGVAPVPAPAPRSSVIIASAAALAGVAGVRSPFVRSSRGPPAA